MLFKWLTRTCPNYTAEFQYSTCKPTLFIAYAKSIAKIMAAHVKILGSLKIKICSENNICIINSPFGVKVKRRYFYFWQKYSPSSIPDDWASFSVNFKKRIESINHKIELGLLYSHKNYQIEKSAVKCKSFHFLSSDYFKRI